MRLSVGDLEAVLSFLQEAQTVDGPEPFTTELLDRLVEIVGCTYASYYESDHSGREARRRLVGTTTIGRTSSVQERERQQTSGRAL